MHMKKLAVLALAASFFGGCNCVGREFTIKKTFTVNAGAQDALCQDERLEVNLADDSAFASVKSNIASIEVRGVAVRVKNPKIQDDSIVTKGSGEVRIADSATGAASTLSTYGDVAITAENYKQIEFDKEAANKLAALALKPPFTFFIESHGCNDAVPARYSFDVELTLYASAKLF
ncbi:MAG: hypothetical protein K1X64_12345 [Myxococcaceae bacterium]|nr:hypothetical protein [Myxococcaceae bacterium]